MELALDMGEGDDRIPRLARDWEQLGRPESPAEGFLLSRIDGRTPWTLLREIGGLSPGEVDRCLSRWLASGVLEVDAGPEAGPPRRPVAAPAPPSIDPDLDLSPKLQREILDFQVQLEERSYHEILGVERSADPRDIKRAYFALSKKFHPDRYYGQRIGELRPCLEAIFKKLVEAYELLSDPATRAELERSLGAPPAAVEPPKQERPSPEAPPAPPRKLSKREHLDRLRRMFRLPEEVLAERKLRARQFFDAARLAMSQEQWLAAASNLRLAIAFDPWERSYKGGFAEIQAKAAEARVEKLLAESEGSLDARVGEQAFRLLEEVLHHRPGDAEIHRRAARLAIELNEQEKAREYAERACELEPEACLGHVLLARALRCAGLRRPARDALEQARQIDPAHPEVKREMAALSRRSQAGGKG